MMQNLLYSTANIDPESARSVLVFRHGSIGDVIIALPCLHLVRRTFPKTKITLITNELVDRQVVAASTLLEGSGLVDAYVSYPPDIHSIRQLWKLRNSIRSFAPDLLIYLTGIRSGLSVVRDYVFFGLCGIRHIIGPSTSDLRRLRPPKRGTQLWESEFERLGRIVRPLGDADAHSLKNWDLHLSEAELATGDELLRDLSPPDGGTVMKFIALSVGTKQALNDWGETNWSVVVRELGRSGRPLVLVGGEKDHAVSQRLAGVWCGPSLNLCGRASPRITTAVLSKAELLLCHDSGPMHLAASVGTPCVAVFSRLNPLGKWFPIGTNHKVLYPPGPNDTIQAIRPRQVVQATQRLLEGEMRRDGV
jgi:lipopolysaccharide heptosyltransferase III